MILTIGITSYNRIKELERCIRSIDTKYTNDIEVLVVKIVIFIYGNRVNGVKT